MARLTAIEARKLSGPSLEEKIDTMLMSVEKIAKSGSRALNTNIHHKEDLDLWINCAKKNTKDWQYAKKTLEDLGYKVKFCDSPSDINAPYTVIQW